MEKKAKEIVRYYLIFNSTTTSNVGKIIGTKRRHVPLFDTEDKDFTSPKRAEKAARDMWDELSKTKNESENTIVLGDPWLGKVDDVSNHQPPKKIKRLSGMQFMKPKFAKPQGFA